MNFLSAVGVPELAVIRTFCNNILEDRGLNLNAALIATVVVGTTISLRWIIRRYRKVDNLSKKCVLITGCDSGFGFRLAKKLDDLGMFVIACCLTEQGMRNIHDVTSARTTPLLLDVTSRDSIGSVKKQVFEILPDGVVLWTVVNNAGIAGPCITPWTDPDDYLQVMAVNFHGTVEVNHAFLPLIKRSRGRVVNVASILGQFSFYGGPYVASKFAVEGYSDGLRRFLKDFDVSVSIFEPGFFRTNITDSNQLLKSAERSWDKLPQEEKDAYGLEYRNAAMDNAKMFLDYLPLAMFNNPDMVVDAMVHAVTSKYPLVRYRIGLDAHALYIPLTYLPYSWTDFILNRNVIPAMMKK